MSGEPPVIEQQVLLGFLTVQAGEQRSAVWAKRRELMAFAQENGYWLGDVYVHEVGRGPTGALKALLEAARHPQVEAVAVVTASDLSESPMVQSAIRGWLEEASAKVLVVRP